MPIKGLSERRRLPRLGKLHLGEKVKNAQGVEYPRAVDYFVCPEEVQAVYSEKPRELDILFPTDDESVFASQFYRAYSQTRGLVCKGDGDTALRLVDVTTKKADPETGEITGDIATRDSQKPEWVEGIACPGQFCEYYKARQCRELMNLQFLLPKVPGLGVWQLYTSSYHSIVNINSGLELVRGIFGTVAGIPLQLSLEPMEVAPDGRKKTVHVLNIRSRHTLAQLAEARKAPVHAVLPVPDLERPDLPYPSEEEQKSAREAEEEQGSPAEPRGEAEGQLVSAEALRGLRRVREELGIPTADLAAHVRQQYGVTQPQQLTQGQAEELLEWMGAEARRREQPSPEEELFGPEPGAGEPNDLPGGESPGETDEKVIDDLFWVELEQAVEELGYQNTGEAEIVLGTTFRRWQKDGHTLTEAVKVLRSRGQENATLPF